MSENLKEYTKKLEEAASYLKEEVSMRSPLAIVLGSGLGDFMKNVHITKQVEYSDIPHFPRSTVPGHSGNLVFGKMKEYPLIVFSGRKHLYEGVNPWDVVFSVRVMRLLGVKVLILTNAAGSLKSRLVPGDLMVITDQINLSFRNPLVGPHKKQWGPRFCDMSAPFDPALINLACEVAAEQKIQLKQGIYTAGLGPSYETRAEVSFLQFIGTDVIGMSTVPENIVANQAGIRTLAFSYISNSHVMSRGETSHKEVLENAALVQDKFANLMNALIPRLFERIGKEGNQCEP